MMDIFLHRKIARVIMLLAKRLEIDPLRAMDIFYRTDVCNQLHNQQYGLHCFSDAYIVDEIFLEMQGKQ